MSENFDSSSWFNFQPFYDEMAARLDFSKYAELGVWKGRSITYLVKEILKHKAAFEVHAVDTWETSSDVDWPPVECGDKTGLVMQDKRRSYDIYNDYITFNNIRSFVKDHKMNSWEAAKLFPDGYFDFVFIDANHYKEFVLKDIIAWMPKVRKGGILSGHDYVPGSPPRWGVMEAVQELKLAVRPAAGSVWVHDC